MDTSILNKKGININKIKDIYGEESNSLLKTVISDNMEIIKNINSAEIFKQIKVKTNGEIDLAGAVSNFYIESKVKDEVIDSLSEELDEKNENLKLSIKKINVMESLVDKDSSGYKNLVLIHNKNKELMKLISPRKTRIRKYKD